MFEGSKTPLNIFVEIWILQILMSVKLNFWYQQTVYILMAWKDPYGGLQNPYFLELQQKNVAAGENCPYVVIVPVASLELTEALFYGKKLTSNLPKACIHKSFMARLTDEKLID